MGFLLNIFGYLSFLNKSELINTFLKLDLALAILILILSINFDSLMTLALFV